MKTIQVLQELKRIGYRFEVSGGRVRYHYTGPGDPDPAQVAPLLAMLREHRDEVRRYLSQAQAAQVPERMLTCHDCGHFRPAVSPNPTQAWGRCLDRNKGRYGCAMPCDRFSMQKTPTTGRLVHG